MCWASSVNIKDQKQLKDEKYKTKKNSRIPTVRKSHSWKKEDEEGTVGPGIIEDSGGEWHFDIESDRREGD